jgi:hypothetical protein
MRTISDEDAPPVEADPVSVPTVEDLTGSHVKAADALRTLVYEPDRFQCWRTSRRAAKTSTIARALMLTATGNENTNSIYTALTRGQAREVVWRTIWLPLLDKYQIEHKPNQTHQQSIFPNGSSVLFGGLDDEKHITTNLGNRLDLFISDESQSAPSSLLKRLFEVIIAPAISDNAQGKFLLAGTIPEVPAGYFYDASVSGRWLTKSWSRWDNPFLEDQAKALADFMQATGRTIDDPLIRRDWFGELVFDAFATAFRYKPERAAWQHDAVPIQFGPGTLLAATVPYGFDLFSLGIDPGTRDRWAIVLQGWSSKGGPMKQVAEWVTPRNANAEWSDCARVMEWLDRKYQTVIGRFYDAGGSMATLDVFGRHVGAPVLKAAAKADLRGQVDRYADLMATGQAFVMAGSQLEGDMKLARWDEKARAEGLHKWASTGIHPDVADAARYAAQLYFNYAEPISVKLTEAEREEEHWRASLNRPPGNLESHAQEDDVSTPYGGTVD